MDWSAVLPSNAPASNAPTALSSVPSPSASGEAKPWSPESPMFAFGALAFLALGLAAFSTSVRVGNSSASLNLGKG